MTGFIKISTVAESDKLPSLTLKVNESVPLKLSNGIYETKLSVKDIEPFKVLVNILKTKSSSSISLPVKIIETICSSFVIELIP